MAIKEQLSMKLKIKTIGETKINVHVTISQGIVTAKSILKGIEEKGFKDYKIKELKLTFCNGEDTLPLFV